jgi:Concanavalin A-like lectin/glucanases superfamily
MKLLYSISGTILIYLVFFAGSTQIAGCAKSTVQHDTTIKTVTITDTVTKTVTVRDTLTLKDTVYTLTDGMVAYYNFNGGNLNDSSGHNNNIAFNNALPAADRFGVSNNAYSFDGAASYMRVPNSASLNPATGITIFAIVKVNGFYKGPCHINQIVGKGAPDDVLGYYVLRFDDAGLIDGSGCSVAADTTKEFFYGSYGDNTPYGNATGAVNDSFPFIHPGEWANVVFTYNGTVSKVYLNGALLATYTKSVTFTANTQDLYIGKTESSIFPYYFNGIIDEIRIYNKAIPDNRVGILNSLSKKAFIYPKTM